MLSVLGSLERTPDDYSTSHLKLSRVEEQSFGALSRLLETGNIDCPRRGYHMKLYDICVIHENPASSVSDMTS